jgi:hypothetical protein
VGCGAPSSPLGREAADPIIILTSKMNATGRKIKTATAKIQGKLKNFPKVLDPIMAAVLTEIYIRQYW